MHRKDVPQDSNSTLSGVRKVAYAVDEDGQYVQVPTSGWAVEETATGMAVEYYDELAQSALMRARQELASPLEYHMYAHRLNIVTLAQATGLFQWQVKRHLRQPVADLKPKTQALYSEVLGIEVSQLSSLPC